jgi:nucleotide-binding universal stress UspA family protein
MKTVLAAIDFSPIADSVIRRGVELARAFKARLVLLHVIQPPVFIAGAGPAADGAEITAAAERAADRRLSQLAARLRKEHKLVETKRLTGMPVNLILQEAAKLPAADIVIGSHGHGAVYDLLVGSTTSGVLKRAKCPIVIVPTAERPSASIVASN